MKRSVKSFESGKLVLRAQSGITDDFTLEVLGNIDVAAAPYGYATLNEFGKVDPAQIDGTALGAVEYMGTWDATANTPPLTTTPPGKGIYYVVSVAGTQFGISFEVTDWIISNGVAWEKVDNTDLVQSVAGKTGIVVLDKSDVGLPNVDNTSDMDKPVSTAQSIAIGTRQPLDADLTAIAGLMDSSGILRKIAADSWTLDTSTYLTDNQLITFSGDASGSGTTAVTLTLADTGVTAATYGSMIQIPVVTVDSKGRVTGVVDTPIQSASLAQIGLVQLNSATNSTSTAQAATPSAVKSAYDLAASAIPLSQKGAANGVAPLGPDSLIPSTYLPSYVDDVLEYANLAAFPAVGEPSKIYIALDTNRTYRWSGSAYIWISESVGVADSAIKLATPRTIAATGDGSWSVSFDGSANVSATLTLANSGVTAATYGSSVSVPVFTVDSKGRVTTVTNTTIRSGTTSQTGIVQLNSATNSTSTTTAANSAAVNTLLVSNSFVDRPVVSTSHTITKLAREGRSTVDSTAGVTITLDHASYADGDTEIIHKATLAGQLDIRVTGADIVLPGGTIDNTPWIDSGYVGSIKLKRVGSAWRVLYF